MGHRTRHRTPSGKTPPATCRCFALKVKGYYYALLIMGKLEAKGRGKSIPSADMVGFLKYRSKKLPPLDVFEARDWMRLNFGEWGGERLIFWCIPDEEFEKQHLIPIGQVKPRTDDPTETPKVGWNWLGAVEVLEIVSTLREVDSTD